jgi:hypothetical protein
MEAEWMKKISSETVCNFFYVFFVFNAVVAALALLVMLVGFSFFKKMGMGGIAVGASNLLVALLAATQALFFYLICDRALIARN